jgi:hypothetical protein
MITTGYTSIQLKASEISKQHCLFNLSLESGHDIEIEVDSATIRIMSDAPVDEGTIDTVLDQLSGKLEVDCRCAKVISITYGVQYIMASPSIEYLEYLIPTGGISVVQSSENRILLQSRYGNEVGHISFDEHYLSIEMHLSSRLSKIFGLDRAMIAQDIFSEGLEGVCKAKLHSILGRIIPSGSKPIPFDKIRTRTDLQDALVNRFLQSKEERLALLRDAESKYRRSEISAGSITRLRKLLWTLPLIDEKLIELQSIRDALHPNETTFACVSKINDAKHFGEAEAEKNTTETNRIILFA